jgi:hypothetical protein
VSQSSCRNSWTGVEVPPSLIYTNVNVNKYHITKANRFFSECWSLFQRCEGWLMKIERCVSYCAFLEWSASPWRRHVLGSYVASWRHIVLKYYLVLEESDKFEVRGKKKFICIVESLPGGQLVAISAFHCFCYFILVATYSVQQNRSLKPDSYSAIQGVARPLGKRRLIT